MVGLMVRDGKHRDAARFGWKPRAGCLTIYDREQILLGIGRGESLSAIARSLGRSPSTITREVNANRGRVPGGEIHLAAAASVVRRQLLRLDIGPGSLRPYVFVDAVASGNGLSRRSGCCRSKDVTKHRRTGAPAMKASAWRGQLRRVFA